MADHVKLIASGNSDNPAIFSPHPPTGDDILHINNFVMTCVAGGYNTFGMISANAEASISADANTTGYITHSLTEHVDMAFDTDGYAIGQNGGSLRLYPTTYHPTWSGSAYGSGWSNSAASRIFISHSQGDLTINMPVCDCLLSVITYNNTNSFSNVTINIGQFINGRVSLTTIVPSTSNLVINVASGNAEAQIVTGVGAGVSTTTQNNNNIFINGGTLAFNSFFGEGNPTFSGNMDFINTPTWTISGSNYKLDENNFFVKHRNKANNEFVLSNMNDDSLQEKDVRRGVWYNFNTREGKCDIPPKSMTAEGVSCDDGVGTAQMLRVSDVLDALRDSDHESAEHFRNTSTNQSVQAQLQAALNS